MVEGVDDRCSACAAPNLGDARFCERCGAALRANCGPIDPEDCLPVGHGRCWVYETRGRTRDVCLRDAADKCGLVWVDGFQESTIRTEGDFVIFRDESLKHDDRRFKRHLQVGDRWERGAGGGTMEVVGTEDVEVPAGRFRCFKLACSDEFFWLAPAVGIVQAVEDGVRLQLREFIRAPAETARYQLDKGHHLMRAADPVGAMSAFAEARKLSPEEPAIAAAWEEVHERMRQLVELERQLDAAVERGDRTEAVAVARRIVPLRRYEKAQRVLDESKAPARGAAPAATVAQYAAGMEPNAVRALVAALLSFLCAPLALAAIVLAAKSLHDVKPGERGQSLAIVALIVSIAGMGVGLLWVAFLMR